MISRQTSLSRNIVQFCRFLRHKGFALSVDDETTALNALQFIDYRSNEVFRLALRAVLCRSRSQLDQFDALFFDYWKELEKAIDAKEKQQTKPALKPGVNQDSFKALKSWLAGNKNEEIEQTASYSTHQNLAQQDFSSVPADELDEIMKSIKALSRRLAAQSNRRYEKSAKVNLPDLRQTLRKNMRHGGELMHIMFRKPKRNRTKLVVLCDVSQSMDLYSAFLLQFMYSFQQVFRRIETFAFSTSLQPITSLLKQNDFTSSLKAISAQNRSWSGGTRIGESLHQFVTEYAARLLDKRTIVIILSDGWDTGDITLLRQSMEVIHARSKKVIWLNPLAGYTAYRPAVAGMQTALPFVDVFAPVHNVDSLRRLGRWL
ncbi:VWA domain-containing protein [Nibrella saemangeumensis]|uniref:VWA domain-containing protein n=1 Tax=Nibrella saemangeumensis TaxID=1084526 RepID=A0ABP8MRC7_9BACT